MASQSPADPASDALGKCPDGGIATEPGHEARPEQNQQTSCTIERTWGFSLEDLFRMALKFFKEMNGKAFNPTYEENLRLVALQKHVSLGPYDPKVCPEVGFFDVLGNDRRREWAGLGSMAREDAMEDFVKLLNSCCSLFAPYVTSHKIEKEQQEKRLREEEERQRAEREERERREEEQRRREEEELMQERELRREEVSSLMELQKQQIKAALSAQTAVQFQQHAERQFPNSPEEQQRLIQQLQEQHYQQYIQQAYQAQQTALKKQQDLAETPASLLCPDSHDSLHDQGQSKSNVNSKQGHLFIEGKPGEVAIMAPSMWTRPQIKEFKEKMSKDADSVITVGRGEVLTVRVSTHEDGSYLFWEFATDHYDIGFGLFFEWPNTANGTMAEPNPGQSDDGKSERQPEAVLPPLSEVVPVYRRDSHEEVYAGSHQYPGHGVYLLRFDNSYSLWRSKVVYYRVYYTR